MGQNIQKLFCHVAVQSHTRHVAKSPRTVPLKGILSVVLAQVVGLVVVTAGRGVEELLLWLLYDYYEVGAVF